MSMQVRETVAPAESRAVNSVWWSIIRIPSNFPPGAQPTAWTSWSGQRVVDVALTIGGLPALRPLSDV
jgi:hypothetical protein